MVAPASFSRSFLGQLIRFGIVGLLSNFVLYILYLAITTLGAGHKTAMTGLFILGLFQTFFLNKRWTFQHYGSMRYSLTRYAVAFGGCYLFNLAILLVFVDYYGMPHEIVQGVAVVVVAILMFLLQKYWVFPNKPGKTERLLKESTT